MEANEVHTGKIKFYDPKKGFGFIKIDDSDCNDEDSIFMHATTLVNGFIPSAGERCSFIIGARNGKRIALEVTNKID